MVTSPMNRKESRVSIRAPEDSGTAGAAAASPPPLMQFQPLSIDGPSAGDEAFRSLSAPPPLTVPTQFLGGGRPSDDTYWRYENTPRTPLDEWERALLRDSWAQHVAGGDVGAVTDVATLRDILGAVQLPLSRTAKRILEARFAALQGRVMFGQMTELIERLKTLHVMWVSFVAGKRFDDDILDAFVAVSKRSAGCTGSSDERDVDQPTSDEDDADLGNQSGAADSIEAKTSGIVDMRRLQRIIRCYDLSMHDVDKLVSESDLDGNDALDFFEFATVFTAPDDDPTLQQTNQRAQGASRARQPSLISDDLDARRVLGCGSGGDRSPGDQHAPQSLQGAVSDAAFSNALMAVPSGSVDFSSIILEKRRERLRQKQLLSSSRKQSGMSNGASDDEQQADLLSAREYAAAVAAAAARPVRGGQRPVPTAADLVFLSAIDVPPCPVHLRLPEDIPRQVPNHFHCHHHHGGSHSGAENSFLARMSMSQNRSSAGTPSHQLGGGRRHAPFPSSSRKSVAAGSLASPTSPASRSTASATPQVSGASITGSPSPHAPPSSPSRAAKTVLAPGRLSPLRGTGRPAGGPAVDDSCSITGHPALANASYVAFRKRFAQKMTQFR